MKQRKGEKNWKWIMKKQIEMKGEVDKGNYTNGERNFKG